MKYRILSLLAILMGATVLLSVSSLIVGSKNTEIENELEDEFEYRSFKVAPSELELENTVSHKIKGSDYYEEIKDELRNLYSQRNNQSIWFYSDSPKPIFYEALRQINSGDTHGLSPHYYGVDELKNVDSLFQRGISKEHVMEMEIEMTANYLLYNFHIQSGRLPEKLMSGYWHKDKKNKGFLRDLVKIKTPEQLKAQSENAFPTHHKYAELLEHLNKYREIEASGGWSAINIGDTKVIEPGEMHEAIPQIRERLSVTDPFFNTPKPTDSFEIRYDLNNFDLDAKYYDEILQASVKQFQQRHGLAPDGRLGKETIAALNIPVADKLSQIELNLERMRWLPSEYGANYAEVNIPDYSLKVYQDNEKSLEMKVIVGAEFTSTPIFSDTLKYLVFSPTWTVPFSIKSKEMLPKLQEDPAYYTRLNYKFYRGWSTETEIDPSKVDWSEYSSSNFPFNVVQQPGGSNSLGRVKFIMPNDLSIYLHDTPSGHLFNRYDRAFSHGCIRVEKPELLAEYLLRDQTEWTSEEINKAMFSNTPKKVYLEKDYHVQITYLTAFVDENGLMNFRKDIYGHDKSQADKLKHLYAIQ